MPVRLVFSLTAPFFTLPLRLPPSTSSPSNARLRATSSPVDAGALEPPAAAGCSTVNFWIENALLATPRASKAVAMRVAERSYRDDEVDDSPLLFLTLLVMNAEPGPWA